MMMKFLTCTALLALAIATPAFAEPVTKTVTIDTPKYDGTRIITRDKEAGTFTRDTDLTRKSDGATATRDFERDRTATGFTASGTATGFDGKTRSFDLTHTRTTTGSTTNGNYTSRSGENYTFTGDHAKTETGFTANRNVKNSSGTTVYNRDTAVSRANGEVTRTSTITRAQGFHAPRVVRGLAGHRGH
jgi:hypothetical protein